MQVLQRSSIVLLFIILRNAVVADRLPSNIIEKSYFASFLSTAVYDADDYWKSASGSFCSIMETPLDTNCKVVRHPLDYEVDKFKIFTDIKGLDMPQGDDYVALYKWEDTCYAAWRGTDVNDSYLDFVQNVPSVFGFEQMDGPLGSCDVRRGWKLAYNIDYTDSFGPNTKAMLEDIRTCAKSCKGGCDVVLTGHSQGGAAASVAAVALADLKPYLITFGAPGVYRKGECDVVNPDRTYKFVNTVVESHLRPTSWFYENALWYDRTPRLFLDDTFGNYVILSDDINKLVVYPHGRRESSGLLPQSTINAHRTKLYMSRMSSMYLMDQEPEIGLKIWNDGQQCYFDSECIGRCEWIDTTEKWWHLPKKGRYVCTS